MDGLRSQPRDFAATLVSPSFEAHKKETALPSYLDPNNYRCEGRSNTSDKHTYIHLPNISSRSHSTTFLVPCFVLRWPWTSRLWAGWKPGCGTMLRRRRRLRSSKRGLFKVFSMMVHSFRFSLNAPRHTPLAPDGTSGWAGLQKNRGDVQHEDCLFKVSQSLWILDSCQGGQPGKHSHPQFGGLGCRPSRSSLSLLKIHYDLGSLCQDSCRTKQSARNKRGSTTARNVNLPLS